MAPALQKCHTAEASARASRPGWRSWADHSCRVEAMLFLGILPPASHPGASLPRSMRQETRPGNPLHRMLWNRLFSHRES